MSEANQPNATDNPVNVSEATDEQTLQATQQIENDPQVTDQGEPEPGPYDDESTWTFRKLQAEIKERNTDRDEDSKLSGQGTREELVARLVEDDATATSPGADATADVENGGIEVSSTGQVHADTLQSLSAARRKAQQDSVQS